MKPMLISVALSVLAFFLAALRINHGLVDSALPVGAGLTLDESINTSHGVYLFDAFLDHGPLLFTPSAAKTVFGSDQYLPDYPPLGRFILGATHRMMSGFVPGSDETLLNIPAARLASCFAFALTVLLLCEFLRRRHGLATGIMAAAWLMLMPRVVGHARLASLETITSLFWLATLLPLLAWWTGERPPSTKQSVISGLCWGLLLLTKIQGILVPPLVVVWALWHFRLQAIRPLAVWGVTGFAVFFAAWPWLWLNPVEHLLQYFGSTTERPTLYVWYLGQRWADKAVPWHFPFVMMLVTTPFAIVASLVWRGLVRDFQKLEWLAGVSILWPLIVFALPGTPVYDGVRLFLVIMPMTAYLAARGTVLFWTALPCFEHVKDREAGGWKRNLWASGVLVIIIFSLGNVTVHRPFCLTDYSVFAGGSGTAVNTLGMEANYWADGLNTDFWKQVPEDSTIYVAPVIHQFQLNDLQLSVPIVRQRNIRLLPFEYDPKQQRGLILLIHRLADLRPALRQVPEGAQIVAETTCRGVVLARLIDTSSATWTEIPDWPATAYYADSWPRNTIFICKMLTPTSHTWLRVFENCSK